MESPLTQFTFEARATLIANDQCGHPVAQTITLTYDGGFPQADDQIMEQMASAINNISATYNMGLTVSVEPLPLSFFYTQLASGHLYTFNDA